jgi:hypothetical protein
MACAERHMTQAELAKRWRVTVRTLERWRVLGCDPAWLHIGGRILYRAQDVLAHEAARLRRPKP